MKIDSAKDLKKLIQLCRQMGVEAIEVDGIKMNLGPTPVIVRSTRSKASNSLTTQSLTPDGITEDTKIPTDILTDDQLLFYSAQDHHSNEQ